MKLAWICTERLPSPAIRGGAIQTMIDGVAPFLQQNHDLTIFSVTDPSLPDEQTLEGVRYIHIPPETYVSGICERLAKEHFDVIHVFNRPVNVPAYHEASPNSQMILSLHNDMMHEKKISTELGRQVIGLVKGILTVSHYIKETVTDRFPEAEEKIHIVYSGVDLDDYPPLWTSKGRMIRGDVRSRFQIGDKKVILFAGRLSRNKGAHVLIGAMSPLLKKHPDAVLMIVGGKWFSDSGSNEYIRALHKLAQPINKHVIFTNFIPIDQMPELFLAADIFVCPSQWQEPLARVHYEAMAASLPVITTNRGGNSEVIMHEHNGLLIEDFNSPAAFARAIDFCLSNPGTAKWMALNGRKFVEVNFRFSHTAERLERAYQQFIT
ncbi:MAG TPA: glycosyltransferase family 4 protein [Bacillales bacterium]|nr:glycosyltransferase family 4 protein [Bacillales bacterium]